MGDVLHGALSVHTLLHYIAADYTPPPHDKMNASLLV